MARKLKLLCLVVGLFFVTGSFGNIQDVRTLKFYHTHTGLSYEATYYVNGGYNPDALEDLKVFLADWRNARQQDIDPKLLDILWQIQQQTGNHGVFEVISAYRSPQTNEMLRKTTSGVAESSQHISGKAIDVRLRGLDTQELRDTAWQLHLGGVGLYTESDFVHIDTGRPRFW
jgi:uncharacterized protein YcbK (DUF882 family)